MDQKNIPESGHKPEQSAPVVSGAMDPALKAKWVEALRSGEYEQARQVLTDGNGYCCLGVLCEVAGAEFDEYWSEEGSHYECVPVLDGEMISDGEEGSLSVHFLKKIGMHTIQENALIELNDDTRASFSQIADFIEANIPTKENSVAESSS